MSKITCIFLLFLAACNNTAKDNKKTTDSTSADSTTGITQPTQLPQSTDTIFRGFGNEPFWAVYVINNDRIVYHPADGPDIAVPFVIPTTPDALTTKYNSTNDSVTMELTVMKKQCSDGMSDNVHPYSVTLKINAIRYEGCGREPD
jgi:uncharacterized membrane protein